jgi:tetratricopeptide (TPR) repeat protein
MPGKCIFAALLLALSVTRAGVAAAQPAQAGLPATALFDMAQQAETGGRPEDAIVLYDALANDPDGEVRAEARFRKARLLGALGRYEEAAVTLRALLDEKPDAAAARLELARMLALAGHDGRARRELRQARASGLPPAVAVAVDQFAGALRSRKRLGGSLDVAVAPDTNINRATDARTLDTVIAPLVLSEDARARSGIGLKLGGQAFARIPAGRAISLVPRISARGDLYRDGRFNDVSASALVGLEWHRNRERLTVSLGQSRRWYGGSDYATTNAVTVNLLRPLGSVRQIEAGATIAQARFDDNPLQDGLIASLEAGYEQAFDARSGGRAAVSATRHAAEDPGYSTISGGVSLTAWREIWNSTMFLTAGLIRLEGDERLLLFPDRRREWLLQLGAGAALRRLTVRGVAPVLRARFERNSSSVGIYDFQRVVFEAGLTRAF